MNVNNNTTQINFEAELKGHEATITKNGRLQVGGKEYSIKVGGKEVTASQIQDPQVQAQILDILKAIKASSGHTVFVCQNQRITSYPTVQDAQSNKNGTSHQVSSSFESSTTDKAQDQSVEVLRPQTKAEKAKAHEADKKAAATDVSAELRVAQHRIKDAKMFWKHDEGMKSLIDIVKDEEKMKKLTDEEKISAFNYLIKYCPSMDEDSYLNAMNNFADELEFKSNLEDQFEAKKFRAVFCLKVAGKQFAEGACQCLLDMKAMMDKNEGLRSKYSKIDDYIKDNESAIKNNKKPRTLVGGNVKEIPIDI